MKRGFTLKGEGFYTLIKSVPAQYPAYFSLACGIAGQVFLYVMKNIPAGLLFFGLAVAAFTAACGMDREKEKQYRGIFSRDFKMNRSLETALLSLATLAAAFMRLYSLNEIPSGFFVDEAMFGMSSLDILNGKLLPVFEGSSSPDSSNNASFLFYIIAFIFKIAGVGAIQVRMASVIFGIIAVPAVYFLLRRVFGPVMALAGAFILAFMRWHVVFSRMGFHAAFAVLVVILAFYFMLRCYTERKTAEFAILGFLTSFSMYTYQSARMVPAVVIVFLIYLCFRDFDFIRQNLRKILLAAGVAAVVFAPLGFYIAGNFNTFMYRQGQVSIFKKNLYGKWSSQDQAWLAESRTRTQVLLDNVKDHMLMFNYRGDANNRHNLPGQPELDFVLGLFAVIGFGYALTRLRDPAHFLFVSGFFILMCPGFFTIEAPQSLRTVLAIPCVIFFILTAMSGYMKITGRKTNNAFLTLILAVVLLVSGAGNFDIYFNRQARDPRCYMDFSTQEYEAGMTTRAALFQNKDVVTVPYYLNHASFKFALNGAGVCEAFDLRGSVPAHYRGDKNLIYLLPAEYIYLADYLKTLYPRGNSLYFNNKFSGELIFFTFEAPYGDLRLLKPGVREHGVKVLYYGDHGFTNEVLNQKVPAILLTWYDVLGSRVLSADWRAWLEIPEPGAYEFNLSSRGDSRVYIDGKEVVYNKAMPVRCDRSDATGGAYFKKGIHKIEVKYDTGADTGAVNYGCDGLWLLWKKPGDAKFSIIPGTQLMPAR